MTNHSGESMMLERHEGQPYNLFAHTKNVALSRNMAGYEGESERMWDEFQWERFLQQQDQRTEKYMELLEKYLDDPHRDEIIAREMGWSHLLEADDLDEDDASAEEHWHDNSSNESDEPEQVSAGGFAEHGLYRTALALTVWVDRLLDQDLALQNDPIAVRLVTYAAMTSAKVAGALSDEESEEIGMTIAYLKRALKAVTICIESAAQLLSNKRITASQHTDLAQRLFKVREGIVDLMGEYRSEWRRRFGSEGFRG